MRYTLAFRFFGFGALFTNLMLGGTGNMGNTQGFMSMLCYGGYGLLTVCNGI